MLSVLKKQGLPLVLGAVQGLVTNVNHTYMSHQSMYEMFETTQGFFVGEHDNKLSDVTKQQVA